MNVSSASRATRPAFTLVELLVVFAVIGVLAALLLPVLSRSRAVAVRVRCTSHLHQLGLAAAMYWDDNGGKAFRYRWGSTNGGDLYWFGWLGRGAEGQRAFDATPGALYPYLAGRSVEVCPALDYALADFKLKASGAAYGYGYNLELSPPQAQLPVDTHRLPRPADVALLADAAQVNTFQPPASPTHPMLEEFYYISPHEPTTHFRHRDRANVLHCDGHVGSEGWLAGSLDTRLPQHRLGRLRPERLLLSAP